MAVLNDPQEQINKCLECKKPICNNCVEYPNRVKARKRHTENRITEADFFRLYNLGYSDLEIATELGVPKINVTSYRSHKKLKRNTGERNDK